MSRDYQLAPTTPAATDFWTQGGTAVLAPPAGGQLAVPGVGSGMSPPPGKRSMASKTHRLLRGRYPLAITLAAAGAVVGGMLGWAAVAPRFSASGVITVDPKIITPDLKDWSVDNFNMVMANQMGYLTSTDVAEAAMTDSAYREAYRRAYPTEAKATVADFVGGITVERNRNQSLINCSYSDKSKAVAEAAAGSLMRAYQATYGNPDAVRQISGKIDFDRKRMREIEADLTAKQRDLADAVKQSGGEAELTDAGKHMSEQTFADQTHLREMQEAFTDAQAAVSRGQGGPNPELVYQQIAGTGDRTMQADLDARYNARARVDALPLEGKGPNHPAVLQAKQAADQAAKRVDDYAHEFLTRNPNAIATPLDGNGKSSLDVQQGRIDRLKAQLVRDQAETSRLAAARQHVGELAAQIARLTADRDHMNDVISSLTDTQALTHTITVNMPGEASINPSRRMAVTGLLFLLGGLLPVGGLMLYGMGDSRFRYSDETTEADLAGVALLGILPNLPDRLSDPQQAGVAAHCVHQIRTMLQISRANDEPQVLAVTSASTGDGKTSLTLALGLSYAACGARTLLIDCDLLAAGLTHRLNVASPDGVLEAVANRALLEYVRTTDIADVAILPVGTTHAHHASTLSPVALRRLLSEAKKQFDIVIVDTGPILASIEASLICAAADRTVLTVARNQQRPLVERSIGHLQAIGASLAGVVFNRAQAKDFERSMSGLALRSRPAPNNPAAGGNSPAGATAAKAVAGSFKRAG